jgi:predicted outer membrane repeat protein
MIPNWKRHRTLAARNALLIVALLLTLLPGITIPPPAYADTINIADGDVQALKDVIRTAQSSEVPLIINLAPGGTYTLTEPDVNTPTAGLPAVATQDRQIILRGNGATIQRSSAPGTADFRILEVNLAVTLELDDVTLSNGRAVGAGAIRNEGYLNLFNTILIGNDALSGNGGAIGNEASLNVTGGEFRGNHATNGGAIAMNFIELQLQLSGTLFDNNVADEKGGALDLTADSNLILFDTTFRGNSARFGGALNVASITGDTLDGCQLLGNTASEAGGAIYGTDHAELTWTNTIFAGNRAGPGGSSSGKNGGAAHLTDAIFNCTDCTIYNNQAGDKGGGLFSTGTSFVDIQDTTIAANSAAGRGGGLYVEGDPTGLQIRNGGLSRSTISNNSATEGAGLYIAAADPPNNIAVAEFSGYFITMGGNQASSAGGGIWNGGTLFLVNSIVGTNTAPSGPDLHGAITTAGVTGPGYNLIGNSAGASGLVPSDLRDVDPKLGPLLFNGGVNLTQALLPDSPAIDGANPDPDLYPVTVYDQRGVIRTPVGAIDIGA